MTAKVIKVVRQGLIVVVELITSNVEDETIRNHILSVLANIDQILAYELKHVEGLKEAKVDKPKSNTKGGSRAHKN
jgi:hypothetical protein